MAGPRSAALRGRLFAACWLLGPIAAMAAVAADAGEPTMIRGAVQAAPSTSEASAAAVFSAAKLAKAPSGSAVMLDVVADPAEASALVVSVEAVSGEGGVRTPLGAFSFYPPPERNETRRFSLPVPDEVLAQAASGEDVRVVLRVLPAEAGEAPGASAIELKNAEISGP